MAKNQGLKSEQNTPAMERRVLRAARYRLGVHGPYGRADYQTDFEHGQWWVTDLRSGAQWSVVDCQTADGVDYFDFEQVTRGDSE
jgi:predicted cupin superfamily sugar epimerase